MEALVEIDENERYWVGIGYQRRFMPNDRKAFSSTDGTMNWSSLQQAEEDLVLLDIDFDGNDEHLRHFVAVDHAHQEIVLSLRGTFSVAEIVVDAAAFAIPFGGGQAHG